MNIFRKDAAPAASTPLEPMPEHDAVRGGRVRMRGLALLAAAALALTACSGGEGGGNEGPSQSPSASGSADAGGDVVVANGNEPENPLLPADTNETGGSRIVQSIYSGLVYYEADGTPTNELAESIETTDSKNFTIKIKSGQKFSDGSPVTAKSFVDAWNFGALITNDQKASSFFAPIQGFADVHPEAEGAQPTAQVMSGLAVVDDTTFTVALTQPTSDFPTRLGYTAFAPLPESAYADLKAFGENPVGNGPYKLAGEGAWKHDESIDLVPNPEYDGPRKAANAGLRFVFYAELDAAYTDLQQGTLDVLDQIPDGAIATFKQDLGERAVDKPAAIFQSFTIPQNLPHFTGEEGNLRRQAISYAIDRPSITKAIFQGTRTPAKDWTSPVVAGYSEDVPGNEVLTYDPAKAKQLWEQANAIAPWEGKFEIAYNADGPHAGWVEAATNNLRQNLGIEAEGKVYTTFSQLLEDRSARKVGAAFRSGWQADYPSQMNFLNDIYRTGAASNEGDYTNPEFDALLDQANAASEPEQATALLKDAQAILFKDLPQIPLWYQNVSAGYSENVSNVEFGWDSVPLYYQITKQ